MRTRPYKSGTEWCFWRWTDVDSEYITRLHVIKTPFGAICIHWINKPDPEPYLHDHPVSFLSFILKGWYIEQRQRRILQPGFREAWLFNWIKASPDDRHTITEISPGGVVTLCLMGPKVRNWGFHTPRGWVMWMDYYAAKRAGNPL